MNTRKHQIEIRGIKVEVVRKDIKNLHVGVYPPSGRVRVATPLRLNDDAVRMAVITRLGWIRRQQDNYENQQRQSEREMVTGESHYVQGHRYLLDVVDHNGPASISIKNNTTLELKVRPQIGIRRKQAVLQEWYRQRLKAKVPELIAKWEPIIGVRASGWEIRKMKTHWGSCSIENKRIRFNLELAKKSESCLEYILVHEMIHLLERLHNDTFKKHMDHFLPQWRIYRDELNSMPLAHEDWKY